MQPRQPSLFDHSDDAPTQAPVPRPDAPPPDPSTIDRLIADERTRRLITRAMTASGRYRIVERFDRRPFYHADDGAPKELALFVDVETTGLDPATDRIIQLALVPFEFGGDGKIYGVDDCITFLEDPGIPIPPEVTELTGITASDVAGERIDDERVGDLLAPTTLVIAHNAAFDRRFLERRLPAFRGERWACSIADVPWAREGFQSARLEWLAYSMCGMFYEAHRADSDCYMAIHLLAQTLPSGRRVMQYLLESASRPTVRVWATGAPFESKDVLKRRRYSWSDGADGRPRAWWRDVSEEELDEETAWLEREVYAPRRPAYTVSRFDALTRYSDRIGIAPVAGA
ncbi:MAG TPA: 3'-5' exonuclease [Gemmatimonadaceae bacterium]